jgi:hypothetical protein
MYVFGKPYERGARADRAHIVEERSRVGSERRNVSALGHPAAIWRPPEVSGVAPCVWKA